MNVPTTLLSSPLLPWRQERTAGEVEAQLINQARVVYSNQILPVWLLRSVVNVRVGTAGRRRDHEIGS